MSYKCIKSDIQNGESIKYAEPYIYCKNNEKIGRAVLTKKIAGKWKEYYLLNNVIIYQKYRGKGYCEKMLKCILKKYIGKNIYLEVDKLNIPAVKCYIKCGFTIKDETNKHLIMIK